jgi:hypothetical protein
MESIAGKFATSVEFCKEGRKIHQEIGKRPFNQEDSSHVEKDDVTGCDVCIGNGCIGLRRGQTDCAK